MSFRLIQQGAEARLYEGTFEGRELILKERFTKTYRHPALDEKLTKERLRAELRGIMRAKSIGVRTPGIYFVDPKTNSIYMEKIQGASTANEFIRKVLEFEGPQNSTTEICLTQNTIQTLTSLASAIGSTIGQIHKSGLIHGDLTTSNILVTRTISSNVSIALIDFGLSHVDTSAEDKGVDLYVLERAILSTHSNIPWFFQEIIKVYKVANSTDGEEVIQKFEEVRLRGRKRDMVG